MRQVVVTGIGLVTPLGIGVRQSWRNLLDGHCGIKSLADRGTAFQKLQCRVAGLVPEGPYEENRWNARDWLSRDDERKMSKFMQYGMAAAQEALEDAKWHPQQLAEQEMTGVCLGSGIGSFEEVYNTSLMFDKHGPKKVSPLFVPRLLINLAAGHVSMKHGFKGPNHTVTTACTTGAHSLGDAARFIAFGDADVMVAGGAESCIHPLAIAGFERSRSLTASHNDDPTSSSRPFSHDRDGFVMGEGAGMMVLEEENHAIRRNARIYAYLAAYATTSDAHHMTQPPPNGDGALRAMRRALNAAGLRPSDVNYINAHATSTPLGDKAENQAVASLMEGRSPEEVVVSSTKGATGHLLGAAGAVEAVFSVLAIRDNIVPPTLNLDTPDKDFRFNYVPKTAQSQHVDVVLTNSFGFGGTNATLCFKRYV